MLGHLKFEALEARVHVWRAAQPTTLYTLFQNSRPVAQSQDPEAIATAARLLVRPGDEFVVQGSRTSPRGPGRSMTVSTMRMLPPLTTAYDVEWKVLFYCEAVDGRLNFMWPRGPEDRP